jgi:hypothetical protein
MRPLLIALLLLPLSAFGADLTGTFAAGERYEAPADHAPASMSRMFVRTLARGTASVELPAAGDGSMLVWTIPVGARAPKMPQSRLTTPTGDVLRPREKGSLERGLRRFSFDGAEVGLELPDGNHEVLHVARTAAATYRLDVDMPDDVAGVMVVAAEPDSRITMETWLSPLSRQPGEKVTLHARLRDGESAIHGARVTARLAGPRSAGGAPIELVEVGDGVYEASVHELPAPGLWNARFEADGVTAQGVRFARSGSGELIAERGAARLRDVQANVVDGVLHVNATADVAIAGNYRFDVIVAGAADANGGRAALAWGEGVRSLELGTQTLSLAIPVTGDALQLDVRLLGLDTMGVAGRMIVETVKPF